MRIEFDGARDATNQIKHGVSLVLASVLDWESALVWVDGRREYGETRLVALAPKAEMLYYVAYVDRGDAKRIISLRRANRRETKHYADYVEAARARHAESEGGQGNHGSGQS